MIEFSIDGKVNLVNRPERTYIPQKPRSSMHFRPIDYAIVRGQAHDPLYGGRISLRSEVRSSVSRMPVGIESIETGADHRFSPHSTLSGKVWPAFHGDEEITFNDLPVVDDYEWIGDRAVLKHRAVVGDAPLPSVSPSFTFCFYIAGEFTFEYADALVDIGSSSITYSSLDTSEVLVETPARRGITFLHVIVKSNGRMILRSGDVTANLNFDLSQSGGHIRGQILAIDMWERDEYNVFEGKILAGLGSGS